MHALVNFFLISLIIKRKMLFIIIIIIIKKFSLILLLLLFSLLLYKKCLYICTYIYFLLMNNNIRLRIKEISYLNLTNNILNLHKLTMISVVKLQCTNFYLCHFSFSSFFLSFIIICISDYI